MQNLKINGTPTPYWCVVVDKWNSLIYDGNSYQLLGCITLSEMDEWVKEIVGKIHVEEMPSPYNDMSGGFHYDYIDYMNQGDYAGWQGEANSFRKPHPSTLSLLTHNQITLTTETKAVVVKQK